MALSKPVVSPSRILPEDPSLDPYYRKPSYEVFSRQVRKYRTNDIMTVKRAITLNLEEYLVFENVPFDYRTFDIRLGFAFLAVACGVGSFYGPVPDEHLVLARIGAIIAYNLITLFMVYLARYVETDAFFISSPFSSSSKKPMLSKSNSASVHRRGGSSSSSKAGSNNNKAGGTSSSSPSMLEELWSSLRQIVPFLGGSPQPKPTEECSACATLGPEPDVKPAITYKIPSSLSSLTPLTISTTASGRALGPQRVETLGELLRGHRVRFGVRLEHLFDTKIQIVAELLDGHHVTTATTTTTTSTTTGKNSKAGSGSSSQQQQQQATAQANQSGGGKWLEWLKPPTVLRSSIAEVPIGELFDADGFIYPPRLRMTLDGLLVQLIAGSN